MAKTTKFYGTGRRKSSIARVYITPGTGKIVINKKDMDEYFGLDTLKVCVAYKMPDGTDTENFPATLEELEGCEPVYEEFSGFNEDISKASSFDELPENCKKYIARLEELVG